MAKPKILIDSNILIEGIMSNWSASKALLILIREVQLFQVFISAISIQEIEEFLISKGEDQYIAEYLRYLKVVRIKELPIPSKKEVLAAKKAFLPELKHIADLPILITAIKHNMDWIITNNREHFNDKLAKKINIKINSASEFLQLVEIS